MFQKNNNTNATSNVTNSTNITNVTSNITNTSDLNDTFNETLDKNDTNSATDAGDIVHKQVFTVTEDTVGQNEGMEPGTYVLYYTENDGPIKVEKIA